MSCLHTYIAGNNCFQYHELSRFRDIRLSVSLSLYVDSFMSAKWPPALHLHTSIHPLTIDGKRIFCFILEEIRADDAGIPQSVFIGRRYTYMHHMKDL